MASRFSKLEMKDMIGMIAADIRGDWSNGVMDRIESIKELYEELEEECPFIDAESALKDGRWFRDDWTGYYGNGDRCDLSERAIIYLYLTLNHPHNLR